MEKFHKRVSKNQRFFVKYIFFLFLIFSFFVSAHDVARKKIDQAKLEVKTAKDVLDGVLKRVQSLCNNGARITMDDTYANKYIKSLDEKTDMWKKECDESNNMMIIPLREKYTKAFQEAQSLFTKIFVAKGGFKKGFKAMAPLSQQRWLESQSLEVEYYTACQESDDPQLKEAYEKFQNSLTPCEKAMAKYQTAYIVWQLHLAKYQKLSEMLLNIKNKDLFPTKGKNVSKKKGDMWPLSPWIEKEIGKSVVQ